MARKQPKRERGIFEKVPGSGAWWIRYADASGRIRREKIGLKAAAITLYQKRKTEVLQGKKLPETRKRLVSFEELSKDAMDYSKAHQRDHRHDGYRMERLKGKLRDRPAESIPPQDIERFLSAGIEQDKWAPATANRYRALLSLTYRLGIRDGKVSTNPARLVRHRPEHNARVRWLAMEEEKRLREIMDAKHLSHLSEFDLALNTGLRWSEMYWRTWEDADLERRILTVPRSKNGERRHVPLNSVALAALEQLRSRGDGTGWIFRNERGERLTGPRYWFEAAIKDAKIQDFHWHDLRHSYASRLIMGGVDLRTVQESMGHKTIAMTCRYAHLAPTYQLAAVERLAEINRAIKEGKSKAPTDTRTDTGSFEPLPEQPERTPQPLLM